MKSEHGDIEVFYTKSGLKRYQVEIRHKGLHKFQSIKGDDEYLVRQKARTIMSKWNQMWDAKEAKEQKAAAIKRKKELALEMSNQATAALTALENILTHTLSVNDSVDWEAIKKKSKYPITKPSPPNIPRAPQKTDAKFQPKLSFMDKWLSSRRREKERLANLSFDEAFTSWQKNKLSAEEAHTIAVKRWEIARANFIKKPRCNKFGNRPKKGKLFKSRRSKCYHRLLRFRLITI